MASIYELKSGFQNLLRPVVRWLAKKGVTANQITTLALFLSFVTGAVIFFNPENNRLLLIIPGVLFVRMALNAIDGMLAREHNMKSSLGAILNELGDVFSDCFLYLPLAFVFGFSSALIVINVLLAVVTEMTGVVAVGIGASRRYEGPMGKSDRAFLFGLIAMLVGSGVKPGPWITISLLVMTVLLFVTVINRSKKALMEVSK
jgi:phosphatidylglycerophosphate synthase